MDKVKKLIEAGARTPIAIRETLLGNSLSVAGFAEKYELPEKAVSNAINGNVRPTDALVEALSSELGGTPDEWKMLLWEAARPTAVAS